MDTIEIERPRMAAGPRWLFTVDELVQLEEFNFLSAGAMRHMIFKSGARYGAGGEVVPGNGLAEAGAIIRIGGRVLIDLSRFRAWIEAQRVKDNGPN